MAKQKIVVLGGALSGPTAAARAQVGLMVLGDEALYLTPEGAHYKNGIIPLFAAPSIQAYLIGRDPTKADDLVRNRKIAVRVAG